jgi:flagellar biosynthesis protein FlhB
MTDVDNELPTYTGILKAEYFQAYFGDQWGYYLPIMIDLEKGKKFCFNVWAFFFGLFWQLYRKLYTMMFLFITIAIVESIIRKWAIQYWSLEGDSIKLINLIVILIYGTVYGYTGNSFLMRKAQKKIALILSTENDEIIILEKIRKTGSENRMGVTLVLAIIFGMCLLISIFNKAG